MALYHGDLFAVLPTLEADSLDACVCDPPYNLSFMGKSWDSFTHGQFQDWCRLWACEVYRVLKPGAHLVAFGGTRTSHRLTCALEDAGFEIRDCLMWLYGSGFPKSLDVGKAIDKAAGAERKVIRTEDRRGDYDGRVRTSTAINTNWRAAEGRDDVRDVATRVVSAPATDAAKQWDGWGTALKPAWEPIILARKPLVGTVAENVLRYGTGALNIDGCRIDSGPSDGGYISGASALGQSSGWNAHANKTTPIDRSMKAGRWPANVLLDEDAAARLDAQSGYLTGGGSITGCEPSVPAKNTYGDMRRVSWVTHGDSGGASRFFLVVKECQSERFIYTAKPGRRERDLGCEGLDAQTGGAATDREDGTAGLESPRAGAGRTGGAKNIHPTVKPIEVMRWLVRLVTPPDGTVLDPFMGSGTTGMACRAELRLFVGIERDAQYMAIAEKRLNIIAPLFNEVETVEEA